MSIQSGVDQAVREELLKRAAALAPALRQRAQATEDASQVSQETMQDIIDAELVRIGTPIKFGGLDVDVATMYEVAMEFSRSCPSTGWVYVLQALHAYWMGFWSMEAQEEVFADGPDMLSASVQLGVKSEWRKVPGGYRVSGHGKFASGCDHSQWMFVVAPGQEGIRQFILPRSDYTIDAGSWDVSGLRGTGSKDVLIEDAFVPEHRGKIPRPPVDFERDPDLERAYGYHRQRRYLAPMSTLQDLTCVAIGGAQGAAEELIARTRGTSGSVKSADSTMVQTQIAEATVEVAAARSMLLEDMEVAQRIGEAGDYPSIEHLTAHLRNRGYGCKLSVQAVNRIFDLGGARSLSTKDPLQRLHRDVHAATHGPLGNFNIASQPYARAVLGLDPLGLRL